MSLFHLWKFHSMALLAGCILDWLMGDPYWLFHPVRFMGNMISGLEKKLRALLPHKPFLAGTILTIIMCLFWSIIPGLLFYVTGKYLGLRAKFILESFSAISFWRPKAFAQKA